MRSEFEKWLDENNMFMEIERKFNQEHNTYEYCAIRWIWESWQHQQSKVDELQKRVDAVIIEIENMYLSGAIGFDTVKKLEQALKGEG